MLNIPKQLKKVRKINLDKNFLINFENEIKQIYEKGSIRGPIHLMNNSEDYLIKIFSYINKSDMVFSYWRNHLHALLHGVDIDHLKKQILNGRSMGVYSTKPFFMSSSIVGGTVPIALGSALSIKRKKQRRKVWCFVGDMTSNTGIFHEAHKYSLNFDLPITFIIEDNGKSTNTPTDKVWGNKNSKITSPKIIYYKYKLSYPHHGTGKWVLF